VRVPTQNSENNQPVKGALSTDKNEIEGEEGVNAYKGIFVIFSFEVYRHMDKQLIVYGK